MQRYSRDGDRDDAVGRRAQSRNEDRYPQDQWRDRRGEVGGRQQPDYERGSAFEGSGHGANPGPGRWRETGGGQDRFEDSYSRRDTLDDDQNSGWYQSRHGSDRPGSWQPDSSPRGSRRSQFGETEYGGYGPRYGSSYGGGSIYDSGYGQSGGWRDERTHDPQHRFEPDYQQWRDEQIRNLDDDYRNYRRERYRKFSDDFDSWRKNRERRAGSATAAGSTVQESGSTDPTANARDSLGTSKSGK